MSGLAEFCQKAVWTAEVSIPGLRTVKRYAQDVLASVARKPFRSDFLGLRHFEPPKLILDVGAYRGQSILAFRALAPDAQIVGVEANPVLAKLLEYKLRSDVQIINAAISDRRERRSFYVPFYRDVCLDMLGAMDYNEAAGWANQRRYFFFDPKRIKVETHTIDCVTVDSLGLSPSLVKLTIQQHELTALRGATETIARCRPIIMSAWPQADVCDYLSQFGYRHYGYKNGYFVPRLRRYMGWFLLDEHEAAMMPRRIRSPHP